MANLQKYRRRVSEISLHEETAHHKHTWTSFRVQRDVFQHQNQRHSVDQHVRREKAEHVHMGLITNRLIHSALCLIVKMKAQDHVTQLTSHIITSHDEGDEPSHSLRYSARSTWMFRNPSTQSSRTERSLPY